MAFPYPTIDRRAHSTETVARRVYTLPLEQLRPSIRIAHRSTSRLLVPSRVIFDHEIVLICAGSVEFQLGSRPPQVLSAGDLLVIAPFLPHRFHPRPAPAGTPDDRIVHVAVHFDLAPAFPAFASNLPRRTPYEVRLAHGHRLPPHLTLPPSNPLRGWVEELVPLFARPDALSRLRAETLLLQVLVVLLVHGEREMDDSPAVSGANRARIKRALDYAEAHLDSDLSPAVLARTAGLSTSHLTRLFRQWTGLPPGEYLMRRRVDRARRLLADGRLSIKEVAARCGFADPYYFSKVFRRIDGLPPSQCREALLASSVSVDSIL